MSVETVESLWESGKFHEFRELTWIYAMAWVLRMAPEIVLVHQNGAFGTTTVQILRILLHGEMRLGF